MSDSRLHSYTWCNRRSQCHHDDRERHKRKLCRDLPRRRRGLRGLEQGALDAGHGEATRMLAGQRPSLDKTSSSLLRPDSSPCSARKATSAYSPSCPTRTSRRSSCGSVNRSAVRDSGPTHKYLQPLVAEQRVLSPRYAFRTSWTSSTPSASIACGVSVDSLSQLDSKYCRQRRYRRQCNSILTK